MVGTPFPILPDAQTYGVKRGPSRKISVTGPSLPESQNTLAVPLVIVNVQVTITSFPALRSMEGIDCLLIRLALLSEQHCYSDPEFHPSCS